MKGKEQIDVIIDLYNHGNSYHEISVAMDELFGVKISDDAIRKRIKRKTEPTKKKKKLSRCLVLSDLHVPYNRNDIIDIVKEQAWRIDTLILGGDIVDCESISVFQALGQVPLVQEMEQAWCLLKDIEDLTPNVNRIIMFGNHEARFEKYLAAKGGELQELHSKNILREIINGFESQNHINGATIEFDPLNYTVINNWWYKHNDLIVCHPKDFSKIQGRTTVNACEYFTREGEDFNAIFTAHTHKIAEKIPNLNKWCYEIGCLCKEMPYSKEGKLGYTPQNHGYGLAIFEDGKFSVNKSKVVVLGNEHGV